MNILRLRLLVSVSRTLSFTRTANDFFMTQPAVSHQIKALEDSLGVQLLQRRQHVLDGHAGGRLGLVGVTQDGIGDQQGFIR